MRLPGEAEPRCGAFRILLFEYHTDVNERMDLDSAEKQEVLVETRARKEPLFCSRYVSVPTSGVWKVWTFLTRRSHDFSGNRAGPSRRVTKPLDPRESISL
jgi:hypothetical protein